MKDITVGSVWKIEPSVGMAGIDSGKVEITYIRPDSSKVPEEVFAVWSDAYSVSEMDIICENGWVGYRYVDGRNKGDIDEFLHLPRLILEEHVTEI